MYILCVLYTWALPSRFREHTQHMFPYSLDSVCVAVKVVYMVESLPLWKEVKPIKIPTCIKKKTALQYTYYRAYNWMTIEVEIYGLFIFTLMTFCFFGDKVLFYIYEFCI